MSLRVTLKEARETSLLALPIVIGQVSQMLMGLIDTLMIGRVGTVSLAASGLAGNVFNFFFIFAIGLMQPVSVLVARSRGRGERAEARAFFHQGLLVALILGVLECLAMLAVGMQLHRFGQPPEVVAEAGPFFAVIAVSIIPAMLFQVCRQYGEAQGTPWTPMIIMLGGVALNAGLNRILIYGAYGIPGYGLLGAGLATLVSRCAAALVLGWWLFGRRERGAGEAVSLKFHYDRAKIAELLRLGIPAGSQLLFEGGAFTAAAVMMGWLGTAALAAHQIAITCCATTFMFVLGLAIAVSIRVGEASGAGNRDRMRAIGWGGLGMAVAVMAVFALVLAVFGQTISHWFVKDETVVLLTARLLLVASVFQIFDGGQVVGSAMLRGMSDVAIPTMITLTAYWGVAIPLGYVLGLHTSLGALGIWWALAGGLGVASVFFAVRFRVLTGALPAAPLVADTTR